MRGPGFAETAVNIGFSCQLLSQSMLILEDKDINCILETYWESNSTHRTLKLLAHQNMALVISGEFLDKLLLSLGKEPRALVQNVVVDEVTHESIPTRMDFLQARRISQMWRNLGSPMTPSSSTISKKTQESPEVRREWAFVELASKCQAVICCRVTPKQKALVVALVKKYQKVVTLAIGDGANDVNMLKTADIGVGLMGHEGMQAVQNSDYVLAQFCHLRRLLLVHGRWSYLRVCKFFRYFFYKTVAGMMAQIWFSMYNGFTAQDVTAEKSLRMPELYTAGQKEELFNYTVFLQALLHGILTSTINFFMTTLVSQEISMFGTSSDYQSFGVLVAISGLLSITLELILVIKYWTLLCVGSILLSLGSYVLMTCLTQSFWLYKLWPKTFPFLYADYSVLTQPINLLVILLNVSLNTVPALGIRMIYKTVWKLRPKEEEEKKVSTEEVEVEPTVMHLRRGIPARRSSYAFSHREGYANLIMQGTILRTPTKDLGEQACDSPVSSEEEVISPQQEQGWKEGRISFFSRKRRLHLAKELLEDAQVHATGSAHAVDTRDTSPSDGQKQPPATASALSTSPVASSSEDQAFYSADSQFTLQNQPERLDARAPTREARPSLTYNQHDVSLEGARLVAQMTLSLGAQAETVGHESPSELEPAPTATRAEPRQGLPDPLQDHSA